jgi:hypothetical protein
LTDVAKSFEAKTGNIVQAKYGPSGVLRDEIAGGGRPTCSPLPTWTTLEPPNAQNAASPLCCLPAIGFAPS